MSIRIGTAGWSIPRSCSDSFEGAGAHLDRYSRVLSCAEINSSFHRPHRPSTYVRWAASTPVHFCFSVKVPKTITHRPSLAPSPLLEVFLDEARNLGYKLGPILFQLPPRQAFQEPEARALLKQFRSLYPAGSAVLEPRNPGWFTLAADELLQEFQIARVAADPALTTGANEAAGHPKLIYHRLHGSPRVYYSSYSEEWLAALATRLAAQAATAEVWCVFDNTASGAAAENALTLTRDLERLKEPPKTAS